MLKGKKTYIIMGVIILQAVLAYLSGDVSLQEAINQVLLGTGLGALRAGVAK